MLKWTRCNSRGAGGVGLEPLVLERVYVRVAIAPGRERLSYNYSRSSASRTRPWGLVRVTRSRPVATRPCFSQALSTRLTV